jgi:hypothetical protein
MLVAVSLLRAKGERLTRACRARERRPAIGCLIVAPHEIGNGEQTLQAQLRTGYGALDGDVLEPIVHAQLRRAGQKGFVVAGVERDRDGLHYPQQWWCVPVPDGGEKQVLAKFTEDIWNSLAPAAAPPPSG